MRGRVRMPTSSNSIRILDDRDRPYYEHQMVLFCGPSALGHSAELYLRRHLRLPLGMISRYRPPPSNSRFRPSALYFACRHFKSERVTDFATLRLVDCCAPTLLSMPPNDLVDN